MYKRTFQILIFIFSAGCTETVLDRFEVIPTNSTEGEGKKLSVWDKLNKTICEFDGNGYCVPSRNCIMYSDQLCTKPYMIPYIENGICSKYISDEVGTKFYEISLNIEVPKTSEVFWIKNFNDCVEKQDYTIGSRILYEVDKDIFKYTPID